MTAKFRHALAGCGLIVASSTAFANKDWKDKDADNDGKVSRAEYITDAEEKFSQMDTNNDSVLSQSEYEQHMENKKKHKKERGS